LGVRSGATVTEHHDFSTCCGTAESLNAGLPKTSNAHEGWHRGFAELLSCNRPNVWQFIKALKTEQAKNNVSVEQSVTGQQHAQGRKKYRDTAQHISSIVECYKQVDIVDYK